MKSFKELTESISRQKPRIFYKGYADHDTSDNRKRIKTGDNEWDSYHFVSSNKDSASNYGKNIKTYHALPDAKILYQGTKEFASVAKGISRKTNLLKYSSDVAKKAKDSGYHAVHFERQGDVGTPIFDLSKFKEIKES